MKKIIVIMLTLALAMALAACGGDGSGGTHDKNDSGSVAAGRAGVTTYTIQDSYTLDVPDELKVNALADSLEVKGMDEEDFFISFSADNEACEDIRKSFEKNGKEIKDIKIGATNGYYYFFLDTIYIYFTFYDPAGVFMKTGFIRLYNAKEEYLSDPLVQMMLASIRAPE